MSNPYTVVVWGDSIGASGWGELMERGFNVALNTGRPIRVVNQSVGGKPASHARNEFDQRIKPIRPDLVIIQFGFNDMRHDGSRGALPLSTPEEFAEHLRFMVKCCHDVGAKVLLAANHRTRRTTTLPTGLAYDESRVRYGLVTRAIAAELDVAFIDMAVATLIPDAPWHDLVVADGVHLSQHGLEAYAGAMATAVMRIMAGA